MIDYFKAYWFWIILVVLIQVLILNNLNIGNELTPYLYLILFFLIKDDNRSSFCILYFFLLGCIIDFFQDTGGVHTFASTCIAYVRPLLIGLFFGYTKSNYYKYSKSRFAYEFLTIFIHHFILIGVEILILDKFWKILEFTFLSSISTYLLILICMPLISNKKQNV